MFDLFIGLAVMTLLMGVVFGLALVATRKAPMRVVDGLAGIVVIAIAVYARWVWEATFIGQLLPFSNLIVVSNWFPLAAGLLAGLVWRRIGNQPAKFLGLGRTEYGSTPRKVLAASVLFVAGIISLGWPLLGDPPRCDNEWEGNICIQTTDATCSPAAGATLLQNYGIYATEQEMAELCLTRRGTSWKGLYRGLAIKGRLAGLRVEVAELNNDSLITSFTDPCILQCELRMDGLGSDLGYQMEGWVPGQQHSLVLLDVFKSEANGIRFLIADPTNWVELWDQNKLEKLWHGQMLRLVPSSPSVVSTENE